MKYLPVLLFSIAAVGCASSPDVNRGTVGGDVRAPRVIYKVDPDYPAELRRERVTGVVRIAATIDRAGRLVGRACCGAPTPGWTVRLWPLSEGGGSSPVRWMASLSMCCSRWT